VIRAGLLPLFGVLLGAASPALPVPPVPPPPTALAAPVPNLDVRPPFAPVVTGTSLDVRVFRMKEYPAGLAFIPGSAYQSPEDRRPVQTPGFTLSVPMR